MNIFHKIALEGLKKNRTRTLVTIIGVVLSAVMITGVTTFGVSLLDYMARGAIQKYGGWGAAFLNVDASFVQERSEDKEVTDTVTFENIGYAEAKDGTDPISSSPDSRRRRSRPCPSRCCPGGFRNMTARSLYPEAP